MSSIWKADRSETSPNATYTRVRGDLFGQQFHRGDVDRDVDEENDA